MARHFSIPAVLRLIPNDLLERFFVQFRQNCYGVPWERMGEREAGQLVNLLRMWPDETREFIEGVRRNVFDLACESGQQALREAADDLGQRSLLSEALQTGTLYRRAMWAWLEAPEVFEKALAYHQIEQRHGWRKRDDLYHVAPRTDHHSLDSLARDISRLLVTEQGRG